MKMKAAPMTKRSRRSVRLITLSFVMDLSWTLSDAAGAGKGAKRGQAGGAAKIIPKKALNH